MISFVATLQVYIKYFRLYTRKNILLEDVRCVK